MNNKILLLTGCPGFIGLNFLEHFLNIHQLTNYKKIYILDLFSQYQANKYNICFYNKIKRNIIDIGQDIEDIEIDLSDEKSILSVSNGIYSNFKNCTLDIVNFASYSHIDNSIKNPTRYIKNNVLIASNLLHFKNIEKIIHISTDEVYGHIHYENVFDSQYWFTPNSPINPRNPYSASKASQDFILSSFENTFKIPIKIVRLSNQFGPYQYPEKIIPKFIQCALMGKPFGLYGNGKNIRHWTPVKDSVSLIWKILLYYNTFPDFIYHISYPPSNISLLNNIQLISKISEILKDYHINATYTFVEDRPGHDLAYVLKNTISWLEDSPSWEQRLKETVHFYMLHKNIFLY